MMRHLTPQHSSKTPSCTVAMARAHLRMTCDVLPADLARPQSLSVGLSSPVSPWKARTSCVAVRCDRDRHHHTPAGTTHGNKILSELERWQSCPLFRKLKSVCSWVDQSSKCARNQDIDAAPRWPWTSPAEQPLAILQIGGTVLLLDLIWIWIVPLPRTHPLWRYMRRQFGLLATCPHAAAANDNGVYGAILQYVAKIEHCTCIESQKLGASLCKYSTQTSQQQQNERKQPGKKTWRQK